MSRFLIGAPARRSRGLVVTPVSMYSLLSITPEGPAINLHIGRVFGYRRDVNQNWPSPKWYTGTWNIMVSAMHEYSANLQQQQILNYSPFTYS